eukprot:968273-Rhodomonas_salina.1
MFIATLPPPPPPPPDAGSGALSAAPIPVCPQRSAGLEVLFLLSGCETRICMGQVAAVFSD